MLFALSPPPLLELGLEALRVLIVHGRPRCALPDAVAPRIVEQAELVRAAAASKKGACCVTHCVLRVRVFFCQSSAMDTFHNHTLPVMILQSPLDPLLLSSTRTAWMLS